MKKKNIPERWSQDYRSVTALHKLPDAPLQAIKTAIEEIAALEVERDRLVEETSLLKVSLEDLRNCRIDNMKLLDQRNGLQDALDKCQKYLTKTSSQNTNGNHQISGETKGSAPNQAP